MIPSFFVSLSLITQTNETYDEEKRDPKNDTKKKTNLILRPSEQNHYWMQSSYFNPVFFLQVAKT